MTRPWVRMIKAAAIWTLPITPGASGSFNPISPNVKVFGAIYPAEELLRRSSPQSHRRAESWSGSERASQRRMGVVALK